MGPARKLVRPAKAITSRAMELQMGFMDLVLLVGSLVKSRADPMASPARTSPRVSRANFHVAETAQGFRSN